MFRMRCKKIWTNIVYTKLSCGHNYKSSTNTFFSAGHPVSDAKFGLELEESGRNTKINVIIIIVIIDYYHQISLVVNY